MHWKSFDYRITSLRLTLEHLENAIDQLYHKLKENDWYDGLFLMEECEPIYGLAFIALQNYFNSSIFDRFETLVNRNIQYKTGSQILNTNVTEIELIIGLANYFKHRDDKRNINNSTSSILIDCGLNINKDADITESPIYKGLDILTEKHHFLELITIAQKWRANLWNE